MKDAIHFLTVALPIGYLLAALLFLPPYDAWLELRGRVFRRIVALATLLGHLVFFGLLWAAHDRFPVFDRWSVLSAEALAVAVLYGWIRAHARHSGTAAIVLMVVFSLQFVASAFGTFEPVRRPITPGPALVIHVLSSLIASATLVLSGIHGLLYLVLYRSMRKKKFGALQRSLPDLDRLARMTRGAALAGFVILGIGLNFGIGWAHAAGLGTFSYSDPFVLVMLGIWIHFGIVAFSVRIPGVTARRASVAATAGFVVLLASALLSILPDVTFHSP